MIPNENNYIMGGYIGTESLDQEYKVYCMNNLQKYFDHNIIKQLFNSIQNKNLIDKKTFNRMIKNDISNYIIEYLPKYVGNFSASNISGQLHFGISDDGIIQGIPYFGHKISINFINKTIDKCFREYIRSKNGNANDVLWLKNNTVVQIIKLNINERLLDDHYIDRLEKICNDVNNAIKEQEQYKKDFKNWYDTFTKFSVKLKILVNDPHIRKKIVQFIRDQQKRSTGI